MKNLFKKLFFISAVMGALVLASCSSGSKVEIAVGAASADCPMDLGEGLTITDIDTEGNNVVYNCVVDESDGETSVADFDDPIVRSAMKEAMMEFLLDDSDPDMKEFIDLVKDANYNIVYRFVGSHSNAKVDVVVYAHEL